MIEEGSMANNHQINRLLQKALIEIRHEAQTGGDIKNIAALADLFHNVPLALVQPNFNEEKFMEDLRDKASSNAGLASWIDSNT
jgi:hypothetical protein